MRVDPNDVRRLPPGMGFVIGSGKGQKVHITAAPRTQQPSERRDIFAAPAEHATDEPDPDAPVRL
jgi:hypothetical protein